MHVFILFWREKQKQIIIDPLLLSQLNWAKEYGIYIEIYIEKYVEKTSAEPGV